MLLANGLIQRNITMNKTFKVVFNKARGALMVANEVTSSVQKKGMKLVVATSLAGLSLAAQSATAVVINGTSEQYDDQTFDKVEIVNTTMMIKEGANVVINNSSFKNISSVNGYGSAIWLYANYNQLKNDATQTYSTAKLELNNVEFSNNSGSMGGALFVYPQSTTNMAGGSFTGNSATNAGGAIFFKGGTATFTDVSFNNNKAENSTANGIVGGAVLVDITSNKDTKKNKFEYIGDVTFKITKDMTYSGNNVVGAETIATDTYGYWAYTSGGFLFLDRRSKGTFDINASATLTLGEDITPASK